MWCKPRVRSCLFLDWHLLFKKVLQSLFKTFTLRSRCPTWEGWRGNGSLIHYSHVEEVFNDIRIFGKYLELQALGHGRQSNDALFTLNLRHYLGDIRRCVMFRVPRLSGHAALLLWGKVVPSHILGANLYPDIRSQNLLYGLRWGPLSWASNNSELVAPGGNFWCFIKSEIQWGNNGSIHI